jgi:hypothetical protein
MYQTSKACVFEKLPLDTGQSYSESCILRSSAYPSGMKAKQCQERCQGLSWPPDDEEFANKPLKWSLRRRIGRWGWAFQSNSGFAVAKGAVTKVGIKCEYTGFGSGTRWIHFKLSRQDGPHVPESSWSQSTGMEKSSLSEGNGRISRR